MIGKIIVVKGSKNTCKSSSIKAAAALCGLAPQKSPADIRIISNIKWGRKINMIGFTSAGDDLPTIRKNLAFLFPHDLDCAVMACHDTPNHNSIMDSFCLMVGATRIDITNTPTTLPKPVYSNAQAALIFSLMP